MGNEGLRERNKAKRREAIIRSAYRLFAERGFEAATIADVAKAAEVSPRTVTLYFPSKLEIALSHFEAFADRLALTLRREVDWTVVDAIECWLREEFAHRSTLDELSDRMFDCNPQLNAARNVRLAEIIQAGARRMVVREGAEPDDFGPRMAAAAAAAVISELCDHNRPDDLDRAMAFLRAGAGAVLTPARPVTAATP